MRSESDKEITFGQFIASSVRTAVDIVEIGLQRRW